MAFPNDNRTILIIGIGAAVLVAVIAGLVFSAGGDKTPEAPPASRGGLTVDLADAPSLEPTREAGGASGVLSPPAVKTRAAMTATSTAAPAPMIRIVRLSLGNAMVGSRASKRVQ